jgi:TonB family protein
MGRTFAQFVLLCACTLVALQAQQVMQVDAKTIQRHIDHQVFPSYPPIAKAAHVQGTVVFDLRIGTSGKIESMQVASGPSMLQQAATDCLKQWTFHPFEKDGMPVIAKGQYSIIFVLSDQSNTTVGHGPPSSTPSTSSAPIKTVTVRVLSDNAATGPDEELNKKFDDADDACKKGIRSQQFNDTTVAACKNAGELAEKLQMDGNYVAKRSAFVYAATAYGDVMDFKDALPWANKAVDIVKLGHDDDSGSGAAYSIKGEVEGFLGDLAAADSDLTASEDLDRKAIAANGNRYEHRLAQSLQFHAKILQALGRPDEAQARLDEASKLQGPNQ